MGRSVTKIISKEDDILQETDLDTLPDFDQTSDDYTDSDEEEGELDQEERQDMLIGIQDLQDDLDRED